MSTPTLVLDRETTEPPAAGASPAAGPTRPVLELVRTELRAADAEGRRRPGRPTLVKKLGVTDHQVKRALEELATSEPASPPPAAPLVAAAPVVATSEPASPPPAAPLVAAAPVVATSEPPAAASSRNRPWPLVVIGAAAAVAVWGGWVDLGAMTGFGKVHPLPGLWDDLTINSAIVLPLGIEAYGGYALRTWLSSASLSGRTRMFAAVSAVISLVVGAGAQVASHLMRAAGVTTAPTLVTVLVACVPVAVLGLATCLATLVRRDAHLATEER
ncbi:hypothetical protein [Actinokineospora sp. UTMC 2448]|uniref:hypothetical protein n=1 Tax=Actinokineospora sp. UTMC 2448 TaxID=2268449 RepID=UPI0021649020|nr:hypothetical protein [Actinokineospora sp. UTMC 2448]UVS81813.1 hypothetical protein Actkin_05577 [Actinokineospora sp. UTMC 2448]